MDQSKGTRTQQQSQHHRNPFEPTESESTLNNSDTNSSTSNTTSNTAIFSMPQYRIRRMRVDDVPAVLEIWAQNELHEGIETIQSFMAADPDGFVVAVEVEPNVEMSVQLNADKEENLENPKKDEMVKMSDSTKRSEDSQESNQTNQNINSLIGSLLPATKQICCCAVQDSNSPPPYQQSNSGSKSSSVQTFKRTEKRIIGMCAGVFVHPSVAFIGLYGVRPELQGRGIGMSMWTRMMEHIGPSRNAGLYAVESHLTMYRDRAGFKYPDDRLLLIYECNSGAELATELLVDAVRGIELSPIVEPLHDQVIRYDAQVHGYSRAAILPRVFKERGSIALVALDVDDEEQYQEQQHHPQNGYQPSIQGYGCIRTNNIGKAMLGPLYANNDAVAELLMRRLFVALPGPFSRGLLYMTLDSNPGGETIADKLGLRKHEELPRFFLKSPPYRDAKWSQVYCIHSPNFSLL